MKLLNFFIKSSSNTFICRRNIPENMRITRGKTTFKENIKLSMIDSFLRLELFCQIYINQLNGIFYAVYMGPLHAMGSMNPGTSQAAPDIIASL